MAYYIEIGFGMIASGFGFIMLGSAAEELYRKITKRPINWGARER